MIAVCVVVVELAGDLLDPVALHGDARRSSAAAKVMIGGALVFAAGVLIGVS